MTLYGDLDVSIIDELPAGRQDITTRVVRDKELPQVYSFIAQQVEEGRQAYVIFPLVSESEKLDLKSAEERFEFLTGTYLKGLRLGLLHGQQKADQKTAVMSAFHNKELDVLVSTTVIEVGVDVPNATVMLIENAERFGLSQLHQLRGRIGRGAHKSTCILQAGSSSGTSWKRLKVIEKYRDGFRIAEEDIRIRGTGNVFGREQSGVMKLRVADPVQDIRVLEHARQLAQELISEDPFLQSPEHLKLQAKVRNKHAAVQEYLSIG
jgi:ATP-dependent DNA helicase RecG